MQPATSIIALSPCMQLEFAAPLTLMELEISLMYPSAPLLCFGNRYEQLARGKKKIACLGSC
ncbi:MAG TPA: hypothetical protein DD418_12200 [Pseudomonas sp.]|nr:hypothetical protein [Pseudomonas sp.]